MFFNIWMRSFTNFIKSALFPALFQCLLRAWKKQNIFFKIAKEIAIQVTLFLCFFSVHLCWIKNLFTLGDQFITFNNSIETRPMPCMACGTTELLYLVNNRIIITVNKDLMDYLNMSGGLTF